MQYSLFFLLILCTQQLLAEDPYSFHIGSFSFIAINDLNGRGVLSEIFTNGAFGDPIDPSILTPDLSRFNYQLDSTGNFIAPIMVLYGVYDNGSGSPISFIIDTGIGYNMSQGRSMLKKWLER